MATIEKFEDINAWEKARELSKEVYSIINKQGRKWDQSLAWQINKSCGSIMDNIAEGFERGGNKEFIQFLAIAKGSTAEVRSQLYRALDFGFISDAELSKLQILAVEISKIIHGLICYIKSSGFKGYKFKE